MSILSSTTRTGKSRSRRTSEQEPTHSSPSVKFRQNGIKRSPFLFKSLMSEEHTVDSAGTSHQAPDAAREPNLKSQLAKSVRPYSHSPWPIWSLSALFAGASMAGFNPALPPLFQRLGFSAIFAGTGYILSTGDVKNGAGTTTAWSCIYLLSRQLRKVTANKRDPLPKYPRHPLGLVLTGATVLSTAIYGGEYFWFQNFDGGSK